MLPYGHCRRGSADPSANPACLRPQSAVVCCIYQHSSVKCRSFTVTRTAHAANKALRGSWGLQRTIVLTTEFSATTSRYLYANMALYSKSSSNTNRANTRQDSFDGSRCPVLNPWSWFFSRIRYQAASRLPTPNVRRDLLLAINNGRWGPRMAKSLLNLACGPERRSLFPCIASARRPIAFPFPQRLMMANPLPERLKYKADFSYRLSLSYLLAAVACIPRPTDVLV